MSIRFVIQLRVCELFLGRNDGQDAGSLVWEPGKSQHHFETCSLKGALVLAKPLRVTDKGP